MKKYIKIIILALVLNCCGKPIGNIALEDRMEHTETLKLNKGDKIKFWTKIKYR
jgi:PBP1b-binding outer membrane lipoprotein LpoB